MTVPGAISRFRRTPMAKVLRSCELIIALKIKALRLQAKGFRTARTPD
jgi:hypothetical protein